MIHAAFVVVWNVSAANWTLSSKSANVTVGAYMQ
jgi:hypothetical protein